MHDDYRDPYRQKPSDTPLALATKKVMAALGRVSSRLRSYTGGDYEMPTQYNAATGGFDIQHDKLIEDAQTIVAELRAPMLELETRLAHAIDTSAESPLLTELRAVRALLERPAEGAAPASTADVARLEAAIAEIGLSAEDRRLARWKREQLVSGGAGGGTGSGVGGGGAGGGKRR